jgi:hypothetical protein
MEIKSIKVNHDLLQTSLSIREKLFISYILEWQDNNKICNESNAVLATRFGLSVSGIRKIISKLDNYDFFQLTYSKSIINGGYFSKRTITIDMDKLIQYVYEDIRLNNIIEELQK